jgi:hypothetical protein
MTEYDADILAWSERQAAALRRRAISELDWDNLAEKIDDVGRTELRACEDALRQALRNTVKAEAWPSARGAPTWRADATFLRQEARQRFTSSMRQRIDLAELYADAIASMPKTMDFQPPGPVTETCPWTLDQLLGGEAL